MISTRWSRVGKCIIWACALSLVACGGGKVEVKVEPPPPPPVPVVVAPPPPPPKPEPPPPPPEPIKLPAPVKFATGSDALTPEADDVLRVVLEHMQQNADTTLLRVEGHTDNVGGAAPNQLLSEKRALAVSNWLVSHSVDCKRVLPVGFGESKPVADNKTEEGRAQNRRTVFVAAAIRGKNVDAAPENGGKIAGQPCGLRGTFAVGQVWGGTYKCAQGETNMKLRINRVQGKDVDAVFEFAVPSGVKGSFKTTGRYDAATHKAQFTAGPWVQKPTGYATVGMNGEMSEGQFNGTIIGTGCSSFALSLGGEGDAKAAAPATGGGKTMAITGKWHGTVTEHANKYEVSVDFPNEDAGTVSYGAPFNCTGTWSKTHRSDAEADFDEKITKQGGRTCATSGHVQLFLQPDKGTIRYSWGGGQAGGELTRAH